MDLQGLNALLSRVKVEDYRGWLYLRATFPPKPGENAPKRRRVPLKCKSTAAGLRAAKIKALDAEAKLLAGTWAWEDKLEIRTVKEWIAEFERDYWKDKERTVNKENTYHKEYRLTFNKLPMNQPLTEKLMRQVILETPAQTRVRTRVCRVFTKLARFAGINVTFRDLGGGYQSAAVDDKTLPSDALIWETRNKLPKIEWRRVYELMACYGLRNHEAFFIDWERYRNSQDKKLWLCEGKTGSRLLYPILGDGWEPDWDGPLPDLDLTVSHNAIGGRVTSYFRQYIGFKPYSLRHAWARRAFERGLPADFCAKAMGHSLSVHLKIYRRFWGDEPYIKVYEKMMGGNGGRAE